MALIELIKYPAEPIIKIIKILILIIKRIYYIIYYIIFISIIPFKITKSSTFDRVLLQRRYEQSITHRKNCNLVTRRNFLFSLLSRELGGIGNSNAWINKNLEIEIYIEKYIREIKQLINSCAIGEDKRKFLFKAKLVLGNTAVFLVGGTSLGTYHFGFLEKLIENGLFPEILVGSSFGALVGALYCYTWPKVMEKINLKENIFSVERNQLKKLKSLWKEELECYLDILDLGDYLGAYKRIYNLFFKGRSADLNLLIKTTADIFGDLTFLELYQRNPIDFCIVINSENPCLSLNTLSHISTPSLLIRSAIAVSCTTEYDLNQPSLIFKNQNGNLEPFNPWGVKIKWEKCGFYNSKLLETISSFFNVTNFVISDVSPLGINEPWEKNRIPYFFPLFRPILRETIHVIDQLRRLNLFPKSNKHVKAALIQTPVVYFEKKRHSRLNGAAVIISPRIYINDFLIFCFSSTKERIIHGLKRGREMTDPLIGLLRSRMELELHIKSLA